MPHTVPINPAYAIRVIERTNHFDPETRDKPWSQRPLLFSSKHTHHMPTGRAGLEAARAKRIELLRRWIDKPADEKLDEKYSVIIEQPPVDRRNMVHGAKVARRQAAKK